MSWPVNYEIQYTIKSMKFLKSIKYGSIISFLQSILSTLVNVKQNPNKQQTTPQTPKNTKKHGATVHIVPENSDISLQTKTQVANLNLKILIKREEKDLFPHNKH